MNVGSACSHTPKSFCLIAVMPCVSNAAVNGIHVRFLSLLSWELGEIFLLNMLSGCKLSEKVFAMWIVHMHPTHYLEETTLAS